MTKSTGNSLKTAAVAVVTAVALWAGAQLGKVDALETRINGMESLVQGMAQDIRDIRSWMIGPPKPQ